MAEGVNYHWDFDDTIWEPSIPQNYSLECFCNISVSTNNTDPCYSPSNIANYNTTMHFAAMFIIMGMKFF